MYGSITIYPSISHVSFVPTVSQEEGRGLGHELMVNSETKDTCEMDRQCVFSAVRSQGTYKI
jgi:hypothetical protein